ncbi:MAG: acyl-CoA thioester hydrolase, partial [Myxococcota bacterium]
MSDWPVSVVLPVLWGDMDALGHVNNTRYFVWFEAARMAYFNR